MAVFFLLLKMLNSTKYRTSVSSHNQIFVRKEQMVFDGYTYRRLFYTRFKNMPYVKYNRKAVTLSYDNLNKESLQYSLT